jgi:flavin reductase (DIM6/NTAB) family NADH-FMN oxidoreductase RutF
MRGIASTVFVITTVDDTGPHGMAASAVISVSMDPPAMLIAVNRNASINPVLTRSGRFCVNVLADGHGHVVVPFSNSARRHERFLGEDWATGEEGLPVLRSAQGAVFCTAWVERSTPSAMANVLRISPGCPQAP